MLLRPIAALIVFVTSPIAYAEGVKSFTDKNGAQYTILSKRAFTQKLTAQMIEIINGDTAFLMEMGLDCEQEQYAYLGIAFDLPVDAPREEEALKVRTYSDSLLSDRIGAVPLTDLDANLENDSVIKLFNLGCERE